MKMREDQGKEHDQITKNHQRKAAERRTRFWSFLKMTRVALFVSYLENYGKPQSPQ